ncbi:MAG TPA: DbpA RNA binding domain-containing protein [Bacilli bacterium]|nr:DbpA RNA binding domain-containing protein [Bacilli bacterium]HPS18821.1 DbpA RNA binding domain-containing protein [Bacilli bacterium]
MSSLKDTIKETLAEDLSHEKEVVAKVKAELAEDGVNASDADLCAVFFKLRRSSSSSARGPRPEGGRRYVANPNNQRFFINIGSVDGLTRDELVKFVNKCAPDISEGDFRDVYIKDRFSFFEVGKEKTDDVLSGINNQKFGSRDVRVEVSVRKENNGR